MSIDVDALREALAAVYADPGLPSPSLLDDMPSIVSVWAIPAARIAREYDRLALADTHGYTSDTHDHHYDPKCETCRLIAAGDRLAPADTGRLRDTTCVMCGCYTADHRLVCDNGSCPCERAAPAPSDALREAAQAVVDAWDGEGRNYVNGYDHFLAVSAVMPALRAALDGGEK